MLRSSETALQWPGVTADGWGARGGLKPGDVVTLLDHPCKQRYLSPMVPENGEVEMEVKLEVKMEVKMDASILPSA